MPRVSLGASRSGSDDPFDFDRPQLEVEQDGEFFARCYKWLYLPDPAGVRLSARAKEVYGWILVRYRGYEAKGRLIFPRQETLAEDLGCSLATIERALTELRNWNGLIATSRRGYGQSGVITIYNREAPPWDRDRQNQPLASRKLRAVKGGKK